MKEKREATREDRITDMMRSIDPTGELRRHGMKVQEMAERAVAQYELYHPASIDQTKRLDDLKAALYWISEHAYDFRNRYEDKIGETIWDLSGAGKAYEELLEKIDAARKV